MKNKIIIAILLVLGFFGIFFGNSKPSQNQNTTLIPEVQKTEHEIVTTGTVSNTTKAKATLEINEERYESEITGEISVYDFMKKLQSENKLTFKEKTYTGIGKFIEEINGIKGSGEENWIYYVNGKKAEIGVSNYKIKARDVVSWKYEALY